MSTADAHAVAPQETVIAPPRGWRAFNFGELWGHRDLVYFLTKRELQIRYRQSFFGIGWAVLQPITLTFIFALFFGKLVKIDTEIPYAVFAVAGLVPWLFTAQAVTNCANSLVKDAELISKVYFPRLAVPLALSLSLVLDLALALAVLLVMTLLYDVSIASTFYLAPAFLLLGVFTTFALGTLFAAINVKYRDVQLVVPMLVQIMFFLTPVIYPGTLVTGDWRYLYAINPLVSVLEGLRWALFDTPYPGTGVIAVSVASALALALVALWYFRRTEQFFADLI
ncbi:MAG TPA: ABC transporter permease [Solirubrobacterales bacterium]|nr:ABC transporter permease [Solirubrobacterales bacterium]